MRNFLHNVKKSISRNEPNFTQTQLEELQLQVVQLRDMLAHDDSIKMTPEQKEVIDEFFSRCREQTRDLTEFISADHPNPNETLMKAALDLNIQTLEIFSKYRDYSTAYKNHHSSQQNLKPEVRSSFHNQKDKEKLSESQIQYSALAGIPVPFLPISQTQTPVTTQQSPKKPPPSQTQLAQSQPQISTQQQAQNRAQKPTTPDIPEDQKKESRQQLSQSGNLSEAPKIEPTSLSVSASPSLQTQQNSDQTNPLKNSGNHNQVQLPPPTNQSHNAYFTNEFNAAQFIPHQNSAQKQQQQQPPPLMNRPVYPPQNVYGQQQPSQSYIYQSSAPPQPNAPAMYQMGYAQPPQPQIYGGPYYPPPQQGPPGQYYHPQYGVQQPQYPQYPAQPPSQVYMHPSYTSAPAIPDPQFGYSQGHQQTYQYQQPPPPQQPQQKQPQQQNQPYNGPWIKSPDLLYITSQIFNEGANWSEADTLQSFVALDYDQDGVVSEEDWIHTMSLFIKSIDSNCSGEAPSPYNATGSAHLSSRDGQYQRDLSTIFKHIDEEKVGYLDFNVFRTFAKTNQLNVTTLKKISILVQFESTPTLAANLTDPVDDVEIPYSELSIRSVIEDTPKEKVYNGLWRGSEVTIRELKTLAVDDPEHHDQFKTDLRLLCNLRHPNVVLIIAACTTPKFLLISEFLSGGSLHSIIHNKPQKISTEWFIKISKDVALGLNYLHLYIPKIILFRLSSHHVLLDQYWAAKLRVFNVYSSSHSVLHERSICQAPEMTQNLPPTEKVDVFSFGLLLWEMLTAEEPFQKELAKSTEQQIRSDIAYKNLRPEIPPSIPSEISSLLSSCWMTSPAERPSVQQIIDTINSWEGKKIRFY